MSEPPRVRPVSLAERVLTTALVPVLFLLAQRIPLSHVDASILARSKVLISPFVTGLTPFLTAYGLVELAALLIPRLRRWRHDARGRVRLERSAAVLGIGMALVQAFGIAISLRDDGFATATGWMTVTEHTVTLTGGACAMLLAARWATQRGLVNGYVLWWTLPVVIDLLRGDAFREAWLRGGARDAALLVVGLAVAIAATLVATTGGGGVRPAVPTDDSAYRDRKKAAPRPWFPIPVSSLQPITFASAILMFPAVLANMQVPGMANLQAVLQRGNLVFDTAYMALIALAAIAAATLLYRPEEVSDFMRRLGRVSDETIRADASAELRRAMPATLVLLLTLVVASQAAHGQAHSAPAIVALAVAMGALMDLVRSARAHGRTRDLVCVTQLHDAYTVAPLQDALAAEGIAAQPRGMSVLSLLQAFAPYAPVEIYVRAADAERASGLLKHWAAGEAKPAAPSASAPGEERAPWSPGKRAVVIGGLGVLALLDVLAPRTDPPPPRRAQIAIVRVDDESDPLHGALEDDAPERVSIYGEEVPLGEGHRERRSYARASLIEGDSLPAAWARLQPWLQRFPLPSGERWAYEPVTEPVEGSDEDGAPPRFEIVGLRTVLLQGDPVITTADVEDADVGVDDEPAGRAYVLVTLSAEGGERFYRLTEEWVGRRLAIVVDDHVDSAPVIRSPIRGGRLTITMGAGTQEKQVAEARRLAASLR